MPLGYAFAEEGGQHCVKGWSGVQPAGAGEPSKERGLWMDSSGVDSFLGVGSPL